MGHIIYAPYIYKIDLMVFTRQCAFKITCRLLMQPKMITENTI